MNSFSQLRSALGFTEAQTREFLEISAEKFEAYEQGREHPPTSYLQALKGFAAASPQVQQAFGFAPVCAKPATKRKPSPQKQSSRKPVRGTRNPPLLHLVQSDEESGKTDRPAFTFIDLFAGIGGMRRGFETVGGKCVFTCEWDRFSQQTYRANFPNDGHEIAGDIREVKSADIPDHDLLLAGFPCQPFSIAGVSKKNALNRPHGFACEAQGTLFFDVARIIKDCRPRAFLLENVKNLVSHDKGNTFRVIRDVLTNELGYRISCRVIDAKSWVPQHRERIFIVGFRDDVEFTFDTLPVPESKNGPKLSSILHGFNAAERAEMPYTESDTAKVASKYTLTAHLWNYLREYAEKHRKAGNGFGFGLFGPEDVARTLSARYYKDGSEILIKQSRQRPRRLTPRECARIMGFDAPGKSEWKIPVSDTQAYRQFGNAVAVPVVAAIARHMLPHITELVDLPTWKRARA